MEQVKEINPKIKIIVIIVIILFIFTGIPFKLLKDFSQPKKVVNTTNTIVIYKNITVFVTPTPDGKTYFSPEYDTGIRKMNNLFSFYRDNASGLKLLKVSSTVYDYKITPTLHWFNPQDQKDYELKPQDGKKYLWVFYAIWLDDRVASDTRFYLPYAENMVVENLYTGNIYYPIDYPKQLRILELEYALDFKGVEKAQYFGQNRMYISSLEYRGTAGETSQNKSWLRGGISNVEDGYILYEIPSEDNPLDLIAGINFYSFGSSWWRLKTDDKQI